MGHDLEPVLSFSCHPWKELRHHPRRNQVTREMASSNLAAASAAPGHEGLAPALKMATAPVKNQAKPGDILAVTAHCPTFAKDAREWCQR